MKLIDSNVFFQFWRNESSNVLTICFSALLDKPPKFTFWRTLKSVNTNILFCNSSGSNWYRTGIEGINGGIYGFVKYVESICTRFSITRVVTIGSSMGGVWCTSIWKLIES